MLFISTHLSRTIYKTQSLRKLQYALYNPKPIRVLLWTFSALPFLKYVSSDAEGMRVQSWQHVYHQPPSLSALSIPWLPVLPECQGEVII